MKYLLTFVMLTCVPLTSAQDGMASAATKMQAGHTSTSSATFKTALQKMADQWKVAFEAKDYDKVAAMYSDDAVWITAEGTFHGSREIKAELKKMLDRGDTVTSIISTKAVNGADIGYGEGTYSGTAPSAKSGSEEPAHGSWVVTLKNNNGKWMITTHASVPAEAAGPIAKKKGTE